MRHLNFRHLEYFWTVANEGSIARAAEILHITPQTISGQLKLLEDTVGSPLFQRVGRGLALSDLGLRVKRYADEIFAVGAELSQAIRSGEGFAYSRFDVGLVNAIPKLIACRILAPLLGGDAPVRLDCTQGTLQDLLAQLSVHRLDLVISDSPLPPGLGVKAFNHRLGDSPIAFFAGGGELQRYRRNFPASLQGAPVLLPRHGSALRRELDDWFIRSGVSPLVVGEFDDSALLKVFGASGAGLFPAPAAIEEEVGRRYDARLIGILDDVRENYIAISPERRLKHPALQALIERARGQLFGG